jgi:lipid A 3-O-deacylase
MISKPESFTARELPKVSKVCGFLRYGFLFFVTFSPIKNVACQSRDVRSVGHQLSLNLDNNFFLFNGDDGYYTNGTFIKYSFIGRSTSDKVEKNIFSVELGQKIFIAHSRKILPSPNTQLNIPGGIQQIDRPIAGYLFGKISKSLFYKNRTMLDLGVSIGSIGKNSLGQDVIEIWHELIGVKDYWNWVWNYQVKNEVGVNVHGTFGYSTIPNTQRQFFQLTPISQATIGSTFTDLSQSLLFQIGKLRPMSSSSFWSSRLDHTGSLDENEALDQTLELFFFYKPEIKYQVYNATIQGGMFTQDKGQILSEVNPFVFSHEFGVQLSRPKFSIRYSMIFQTKEAKSQFLNQSYGNLGCSFSY